MPPRLSTMFAEVSVSALEEDSGSEFNAQVAVPPGGLTFIASAAVMQESDDEEEERDEERAGAGGNGGPAYAEDPVAADTRVETATAEGVGGFAHPTETFAQAILAQASASAAATAAMRAREGADSAVQMPVPADHVATAGEQQPPPSGFDVYGMGSSWLPPPPPPLPQSAGTSVSAIDGAVVATAMPSHPG
ncbi:hypothetical protein GGF44_005253, partial [Coemansia sp. RSA 1694]